MSSKSPNIPRSSLNVVDEALVNGHVHIVIVAPVGMGMHERELSLTGSRVNKFSANPLQCLLHNRIELSCVCVQF